MKMNCEEKRLFTFNTWPSNAPVDARRMAKAGFVYTGKGLVVECFLCHGRIDDWDYGDQAMARHRIMYPNCPFVLDPNQAGNIPLTGTGILAPTSQPQIFTGTTAPNSEHHNYNTSDQSTHYRSEDKRLESFRTWPYGHLWPPQDMAKAGFYYLQEGDKVQCAFCNGTVGKWEPGDDPLMEHKRHFPNCPFILMHFLVNMSVRRDTCGSTAPCAIQLQSDFQPKKEVNIDDLGIQLHRGPKHPKYSTPESRLLTYSNWPRRLTRQTPETLVQAGFYYIGLSDQVRCFHCDGGLSSWDPTDDPFVEHARWFPHCGYITLVRGTQFVKDMLVEHPPVLASLNIGLNRTETNEANQNQVDIIGESSQSLVELVDSVLDIQSNSSQQDTSKVESRGMSQSMPTLHEPHSLSTSQDEDEYHSISGVSTRSLELLPAQITYSSQVHKVSTRSVNLLPEMMLTNNPPDLLPGTSTCASKNGLALDEFLLEENRRLKDARQCKICMDKDATVVFLPCAHLITCTTCAPSLNNCPMCRKNIRGTVRTFLD